MSWSLNKTAMVWIFCGAFLAAGCASQGEYKSPYAQEEGSSRAYRTLYPNPFTLDQGPSATSSGDE